MAEAGRTEVPLKFSRLITTLTDKCDRAVSRLRSLRVTRADARSLFHRLAFFWIVWSFLLLIHEGGHAVSAAREGLHVERITVGMGPTLLRHHAGETEVVLRLVPVAGITTVKDAHLDSYGTNTPESTAWLEWLRHAVVLLGGVIATLALGALVVLCVFLFERGSGRRWVLGRMVVADVAVLTVFNFLPVPPLDGGRALLGAVAAWRGAPLSGDALFWVHVGGLAMAVVPMALWTRWTARIDAIALRWGAPPDRR